MAQNRRHRQHYPFAAIVGQADLKLCLVLCAIDPTIGGVLIRGEKGTAKSTAARGLAQLTPRIAVGYDSESGMLDPYNRRPGEAVRGSAEDDDDDDDDDDQNEDDVRGCYAESRLVDTPFVDLPIGATEDRVIGSIDFSATLKSGGKPMFSPGLLAAANRGVLYVDEVNLLPAHLVDILLDAAAMGVNTVQREGMTKSHPANFMLVGTMNREEGELRPQLLDRFGLMVDVAAPEDVVERSQVVRQRIAFERDRAEFRRKWAGAEAELTTKIVAAENLLSEGVLLSDELLLLISKICTEFKVGSLRADITLYKAAMALAAWEGRKVVEAEDIRRTADWVLAHRRRQQQPFGSPNDGPSADDLLDEIINSSQPSEPPQDPSSSSQNNQDGGKNKEDQPPQEGSTDNSQESMQDDNNSSSTGDNEQPSTTQQKGRKDDNGNGNSDGDMQTFTASKPGQIKQLKLANQQKQRSQSSGNGRSNYSTNSNQKTRHIRSTQTDKPVDLDLNATLRAAAQNGLCPDTTRPIIHPSNLRKKVYANPTDTLVLFVVDASGSMSARKRMETVKGTVLALLTDAYERRDRVGVIAFRGPKAEVLLEPTRSVELAERQLQRLPTGGRTPLAHALVLTYDMVQRLRRNEPDQAMLLVVLSDGKANVPLPGDYSGGGEGGVCDAWSQTEERAGVLASLAVPTLFLDTDSGHVRVGRGKELGQLLKAEYMMLEDLTSDFLVHTIHQSFA